MKYFLLLILFINFTAVSCVDSNHSEQQKILTERLDSLQKIVAHQNSKPPQEIYTFLTFQKEDAEEAMNFYVDLFDNSEILSLKRWGEGAPGKEGTVMQAKFKLNNKLYMCSDSPPVHNWDFSPAVSNFVEFKSETKLEQYFKRLAEDGEVMLPLNNYGFSQKFGWVVDRFGVSWQLNLQ